MLKCDPTTMDFAHGPDGSYDDAAHGRLNGSNTKGLASMTYEDQCAALSPFAKANGPGGREHGSTAPAAHENQKAERRLNRHARGEFIVGSRELLLRGTSVKERGGNLVAEVTDPAALTALTMGRLPSALSVAGPGFSSDLLADSAEASSLTSKRYRWQKYGTDWDFLKSIPSKTPGKSKGLKRSGGPRTGAELKRQRDAGTLRSAGEEVSLSDDQIKLIDGVSQVESGGRVACVNTYDDCVVSIGFKQVTLKHGSLAQLIRWAPSGFAKHGIALAGGKYKNGADKIVGADSTSELRREEWAMKFYRACLEPDVMAAQVKWAMKRLNLKVRSQTKAHSGAQAFWKDPTAEAWLLELDNNRPAYVKRAVALANRSGKAANAGSRDEFLDILAAAIEQAYRELEPGVAVRGATRRAKKAGKGPLSAEKLAAIRAKAERNGPRKGRNIVTKIPR